MRRILNVIDSAKDLFSPILSDRAIMKYNASGLLIKQKIKQTQLQPNSVDLTLGDSWKILKPNSKLYYKDIVDPRKPVKYDEGVFETGVVEDMPSIITGSKEQRTCKRYILKPHSFVLMASNEILNIPNGIIGIVCGRSSIARLAVQTEQAGFIDAGFCGTITFEVYNQDNESIILYPGMRIAQVYFLKAQKAQIPYGREKGSKYNQQILATASRIHLDRELSDTWLS